MSLEVITPILIIIAVSVWVIYSVGTTGLDLVNIIKTFMGHDDTDLPNNSDKC